MNETMNIYALRGHKVRFLGKNGYDTQLEHAKKILEVGEMYTVHHTEVGQSSTYVCFEDIERVAHNGDKDFERFNSVMFEDVEPQNEEDDKKHPDWRMWNS